MRRYAIHSQYNMRDIGGYLTEDNNTTQFGRVIRSDCPLGLNKIDENQIAKLGIQVVIDLRTKEETESRPSRYMNSSDINWFNVSFHNGNESPRSEDSISLTYVKMMEEGAVINRVLRIISESEGPVLYHCSVGKDRTGIISGVLLRICGVPLVDVISDYQISETLISELIDNYKKENPEVADWVGRSKPEYLKESFRLIDAKYGSFSEYLRSIKVPDTVLLNIQRKLLK